MGGRRYTRSPPRGGQGRRSPSPKPRSERYTYAPMERRSPSPNPSEIYTYAPMEGRNNPKTLFVRNIPDGCSRGDLRRRFEEFGPIEDFYLPTNDHTGQPYPYGVIRFEDPRNASDAKYEMDGTRLLGKELQVVFYKDRIQNPADMMAGDVRGDSHARSRSPRSPRKSRSPRDRNYSSSSAGGRNYNRSISPNGSRVRRERSRSLHRHTRDRSYSRYRRGRFPSRRHRSRSFRRRPTRGRTQTPHADQAHPKEPSRETSSPGRWDPSREPSRGR